MEKRISKKAWEVLTLLKKGSGSGVLEFRRTPKGYFRIVSKNKNPWLRFHRKTLFYAIHTLFRKGLVGVDEAPDGTTKVAITEEGKRLAQEEGMRLNRPQEWDKKWRLVFFDVPEEKKKLRDAFRYHLQKMGMAEFQRSAFVFPYPCFREVNKLAEKLNLQQHIVLATAETLSNEFKFKERFGLV